MVNKDSHNRCTSVDSRGMHVTSRN